MGEIIKTTARFQDAEEPLRQKPIIQIDRALLPNTVRVGIDNGRDNPFRPDGAIYKSADPIVDYYKFGPNQSRAQSPTDSQLLLNVEGESGAAKKGKKSKRKRRKDSKDATRDGEQERPACWRRWFCCCCRCFRCCRKDASSESETKKAEPINAPVLTTKSDTLPESTPASKTAVKLPDVVMESTNSLEAARELEQTIEDTRKSEQQVKGGKGGNRCVIS